MKKTILSLVTAAAVGVAALTAVPQQANAFWWVIPAAVLGGVAAGGAVGAAVTQPQYAYEPHGDVIVQPVCHFERRPVNGYWRRVRVCD